MGEFQCLKLILLVEEERRIARPWQKGITVKMLGKRISFKALENLLNQV